MSVLFVGWLLTDFCLGCLVGADVARHPPFFMVGFGRHQGPDDSARNQVRAFAASSVAGAPVISRSGQRSPPSAAAIYLPKLLSIADTAQSNLEGELQLGMRDVLLAVEVDRIIARRLKVPSFETWRRRRLKNASEPKRPEYWGLRSDTPLTHALTTASLMASPTDRLPTHAEPRPTPAEQSRPAPAPRLGPRTLHPYDIPEVLTLRTSPRWSC